MQMPLTEHLDELRRRLTRSVGVIMALFVLLMFKSQVLLNTLKEPLVAALPAGAPALHFTGPMDVMFTGMKVAFMAAIIISCPYWLNQFWRFFEPGLHQHERKFVQPFILTSVVLFLGGVAFCYFIALPYTLVFLISMGTEVGVPIITVTDYISLLILLFCGFGLIFETPLVLILLSLLGVVDSQMLAGQRRTILVVILIIAALLTPPDPISQIIMAIPLAGLFELSIWIIRRLENRRIKNNKAQAAPISSLSILWILVATATIAALCLSPSPTLAAESEVTKTSHWTFNGGLTTFAIDTDSIHEIHGQAAQIGVGLSQETSRWTLASEIHMILGPYVPVNPGNLRRIDIDFSGTGASFMAGWKLRPQVLKGHHRTTVLLTGLSYSDQQGRSVGGGYEGDFVLTPPRASDSKTNISGNQVIDNYSLRSTNFSALAGVGWHSYWSQKPQSNRPADLKTTVDGYQLALLLESPIHSDYTADYDLITATDKIESTRKSDRGKLSGLGLTFQFTAYFGG